MSILWVYGRVSLFSDTSFFSHLPSDGDPGHVAPIRGEGRGQFSCHKGFRHWPHRGHQKETQQPQQRASQRPTAHGQENPRRLGPPTIMAYVWLMSANSNHPIFMGHIFWAISPYPKGSKQTSKMLVLQCSTRLRGASTSTSGQVLVGETSSAKNNDLQSIGTLIVENDDKIGTHNDYNSIIDNKMLLMLYKVKWGRDKTK